MRSSNLDLAHGTNGNPQITSEQYEHAAMVAQNEAALKEYADNLPLVDPSLIAEMEKNGIKFNKDEVIFTVRDARGQVIWLEKGNSTAGFSHMQQRNHIEQLAKYFDVTTEDIPRLLRNMIRDGRIVSDVLEIRGGREIRNRVYEYNGNHIVLAALGSNGFLVTAFPNPTKE